MAKIAQEVPLVDLSAQDSYLRKEMIGAIEQVLDSTRFVLGPELERFERRFAEFVGTSEVVGVASGTAALELALQALGIGPGDEVITVAHTFAATVEAILNVRARPVLVDIDPDTYTMSIDALEAALGERTRAVIPVHLYGHPASMKEILSLTSPRGVAVIEDAAQAHGASSHGRRCGALGDLSCFSFYPGKNLGAYGDAGAVAGSDGRLTDAVRRLRNHGRSEKYLHEEVGRCERMDELQAAVLNVKLSHLEKWTEARREHAKTYGDLLASLDEVVTPTEEPGARHVYHLYVVRVPRRDGVRTSLKDNGVGAGVHYPVPLHQQPAFRDSCRIVGSMEETEKASAEILSLPMFPELTEGQIGYVVDRLRDSLIADRACL